MQFPTPEQVEAADHHQLAQWFIHLPFAESESAKKIVDRITRRIHDAGFMLPYSTKNVPEENADEMEKF